MAPPSVHRPAKAGSRPSTRLSHGAPVPCLAAGIDPLPRRGRNCHHGGGAKRGSCALPSDGRARSAAETFLPPGHAALATGALGFNFGGGFGPGARVFDTHGGASHLSPEDVRDLLAYLETIE